ncbi:MAG: VCBS repeat-containing protein, partial [Armatimonadota bacterium]
MKAFMLLVPLLALSPGSPVQSPAAPPTPPAFVDVAGARGIASENSARTQLIDINGDGWLDLVIGGAPFRILFSRPGPGGIGRTFVDGAKETGLADRVHSMLLWGDVNGDGRLDAVSIVTQTADQF